MKNPDRHMTATQERALARMASRGNVWARNRLVSMHVGLACKAGKAYGGTVADPDDIRSSAVAGLVEAANVYREGAKRFWEHAMPFVWRHVRQQRVWHERRVDVASGEMELALAANGYMQETIEAVRTAVGRLSPDEQAEVEKAIHGGWRIKEQIARKLRADLAG